MMSNHLINRACQTWPTPTQVVVSKESDELSTNQCVRSLSGLPHAGNVIVIRHAARCPLDVTHMPSNERTLVDLVVDRCESSHQ